MQSFIKEFDSVVDIENISFKNILKNSFDSRKSLGKVQFSDQQLINFACAYRFNLCETIEQLEDEQEYIKSLGVNIEEKQIKLLYEDAHNRINNRYVK